MLVDKKCQHEYCIKRPSFNFPTEKAGIYCMDHKKDNMINVTNKKCLREGCTKFASFEC